MTNVNHTPNESKIITLAKVGSWGLAAVVEGANRNSYARVTDPDGFVQYPLWDPEENQFVIWDKDPGKEIANQLDKAWMQFTQHPAFRFMAAK